MGLDCLSREVKNKLLEIRKSVNEGPGYWMGINMNIDPTNKNDRNNGVVDNKWERGVQKLMVTVAPPSIPQ